MTPNLIQQLLAALASLAVLLGGLSAKLDAQNPKCLLQWDKSHTNLSCLSLQTKQPIPMANGKKVFGAITTTGNFPTVINNFQDGDIINSGDWNNIETTIGTTNSATSTTIFYRLNHPDLSIASGTLPVANGGTATTSLILNNVILGNGTSSPLFVAPGTNANVLTSNGTTWTSSAIPPSGATLVTAGTTITVGSPISVLNSLNCSSTVGNGFGISGNGGGRPTVLGMQFYSNATTSVSSINLFYGRSGVTGSPTSTIGIQADSAGSPSGTWLASSTLVVTTSWATSGSASSTNFNAPFTLHNGTLYWAVSEEDDTNGANDWAIWYGSSSNNDCGYGKVGSYSGSWTFNPARSLNFNFGVDGGGIAVFSSAVVANLANTYAGISNSSGTQGTAITIVNSGSANVSSSVLSGSVINLTNTTGTVSSVAGTVVKKVGISISSSSIIVTP